MNRRFQSVDLAGSGLLLLSTLSACKSPEEHAALADREVYSLLEERRAALGSKEPHFTIDPPADSLRARLLADSSALIGELSLARLLEIAAENSREYIRQRETLYLAALDLTLERYRFRVHTQGGIAAAVSGDGDGAQTASGNGGAGFDLLLGTGAQIVGDLGLTLARDLTSGDGWDLTSNLGLTITQPLLAGFGRRIVEEPLTQAERDVVYAVRDYERFRREFAVEVETRLYRVLQQHDAVSNQERNFENLTLLRARNEALAESGRLSDIQVDQARQDELRSKNRLISERASLESLLDDFLLFLGLPIPTELALDFDEIARLSQSEGQSIEAEQQGAAKAPGFDERRAVVVALAGRLDYLNSLDRGDDADRRVLVRADELRSILDLRTDIRATSPEGRPLDYSSQDLTWTLGLDLDLPTDIKTEANAYRAAQIASQAAERNVQADGDQIGADLRASLRETESAREAWKIQRYAVALAERRVESTALNLQAGRAETRDLLEAQEALLEAKNAATAALVDYHLAERRLQLDLEALRLEPSGIVVDQELLALAREGTP